MYGMDIELLDNYSGKTLAQVCEGYKEKILGRVADDVSDKFGEEVLSNENSWGWKRGDKYYAVEISGYYSFIIFAEAETGEIAGILPSGDTECIAVIGDTFAVSMNKSVYIYDALTGEFASDYC